MKKIIVLSFCVLAFTFAKAQDISESGGVTNDYKQSSGDKNLEMQFDPGAIFNAANGNNVFDNGLGIRFRLFNTESIAYRLNVNINYASAKTLTQEQDSNLGTEELYSKNTNMVVLILKIFKQCWNIIFFNHHHHLRF